MADPQCLAGSIKNPECAAERFKSTIAERERQLAAANAEIERLRNIIEELRNQYRSVTGLEAALAAQKDAERYRWRPIEEAPHDNKVPLFLARFVDGKLQSFDSGGLWDYETDGWEHGNNRSYFWASDMGLVEEPSHWMFQPEWFSALAAPK